MLNFAMRLLDEILFPNYKKINIKQPVFIISNPRSGTTFLHRLLCLDEEKFVYNLLYHTTFPSITLYRIIQFFSTIDKKIGKPLNKLIEWINNKMFGGWDDIHATGFNKSEEDEGMHFISGISASVGLVTPFLKEFKELYIPDKLDDKTKEQIKKYYKSTIQRWMYALGSDKLFLSKTVMSSGRLEMLHELFPDVKIIFLIRNPYQAIPSFTSMFAEPWTKLHPDIKENSEEYREWGELGIQYYKYFNEQKQNFKTENFITIAYTDLVSHPKQTVLKIYEQLKLEIHPAFLERLEKATSTAKKYKSTHSYSIETYGFEKDHIYQELKFIFDEFGFEK
ncbi:MAG TPA: sulfotransferase [Chitinophagales bacterium]|nr:sulfotransferase [Chitinophagales bacterium]MBP6154430.1 sulfotransferase [Chitinophagales bacterium]HQV78976.1 sulfotransferase [Chitinophagales bacterium]HQW79982.1 sulfotransferase [Chitinophagales bacterium]